MPEPRAFFRIHFEKTSTEGGTGYFTVGPTAAHDARIPRGEFAGYCYQWQGRFKSFPIQSDEHLLTVMHNATRYERARWADRARPEERYFAADSFRIHQPG